MLRAPLAVRDGIWQITLPLPFELSSVNVYLVRLSEGWMLVDCGLGTEESYHELLAQMEAARVAPHQIEIILLTHTHPDHVGQARRLLALTGAKLMMQRDELEQLHRAANSGDKPIWLHHTMVEAGVPPELIARIESAFARIRPNFQPLHPDRILEGGEVIETAIGPWELLLTPGHSPGHLCLWSAEHRILFSGDHILQAITPNIGWLPERDALGEFFDSMQRVLPLPAAQLLPGHGEPFAGHESWIPETRLHHEQRCDQILSGLGRARRTAHELVSAVWAQPLAPFHHRFAVFEVLAHLEYLRRREQVRLHDDGLCWQWSAASA